MSCLLNIYFFLSLSIKQNIQENWPVHLFTSPFTLKEDTSCLMYKAACTFSFTSNDRKETYLVVDSIFYDYIFTYFIHVWFLKMGGMIVGLFLYCLFIQCRNVPLVGLLARAVALLASMHPSSATAPTTAMTEVTKRYLMQNVKYPK